MIAKVRVGSSRMLDRGGSNCRVVRPCDGQLGEGSRVDPDLDPFFHCTFDALEARNEKWEKERAERWKDIARS
ncbi:MAG: hypothetical protein ABFD89_28815 [Bryobacteraceae bacterium]